MIALILFALQDEAPVRTPAIYRIPASVVRLDRLEAMMNDDAFDGYCIEPKATPEMKAILAKGKVKLVDPKTIDTKANLAWRNATIEYAKGEISAKAWLRKTAKLGETVHFLTSPKTKMLRDELGKESYKASFAEMFVNCLNGRPCFTSTDIWQARYWPENDDAMQSWILAMNDYLGPMLYSRARFPFLVKNKPKIVSAPDKPGLFIFEQNDGPRKITFYFNNSDKPVRMPKIDLERATITRGLMVEDEYVDLNKWGSAIVESGPE